MHRSVATFFHFTALASLLAVLSACGTHHKNEASTTSSSSSSSSNSSSSGSYELELDLDNIQVHFPPSSVSTQDESITVRGKIEDTTDVTQLFINGSSVSSSDNLATWETSVALDWGINTLTVSKQDGAGLTSDVTVLTVSREAQIMSPRLMVQDTSNNRLLVWDDQLKALLAVDITSKLKTRFYPKTTSSNSLISIPRKLELDPARNRILMYQIKRSSADEPNVLAVDLTSGEAKAVKFNDDPNLEEYNVPFSIEIEESNAYVADSETVYTDKNHNRISSQAEGVAPLLVGVVFHIDLVTGEKTVLSNYGTPNISEKLESVVEMATTVDSEFLYVINYKNNNVYYLTSINKSTGERIRLDLKDDADKIVTLQLPKSLELDSLNQRLWVLDGTAIKSIDLTTNKIKTMSSNTVPEDAHYALLRAQAITYENNTLRVIDDSFDYILSVDTATGQRSFFAGSGKANPIKTQDFFSLSDVAIDAKNQKVFGLDQGYSYLSSIDLSTSTKTVIPPESVEPTGLKLNYPMCSALNQTKGELFIFDDANQQTGSDKVASAPKLFKLNTETSQLTLVNPVNSPAVSIADMAFHEGSQTLYGLELATNRQGITSYYIRKIDFSGENPVFSFLSHNSLPNRDNRFINIRALTVDYSHNRLLVTDTARNAIIAVDLMDGARTILSDAGNPIDGGPMLQQPKSIVVDAKANRALVLDSALEAVVAVDLETGKRTIVVNNQDDSFNKLYSPQSIDIHPIFNYLVITDDASDTILAVDLETNQKVILSR